MFAPFHFAMRARLSIRDDGVTIATHQNLNGTLLAHVRGELYLVRRKESVTKNICLLTILLLVALAAGCATHDAANQNSAPTTVQASDNSEITTTTNADGTKTETRTFKNNPHISKVVVTTRDGKRTVKVYSPNGEEREVKTDENVLEATGDKIAASAGWVADKAEDVPGEAKTAGKEVADKAEDVGDKAKKVGEKTVDVSKQAGEKTVDVTKKAGEKTVEGAKKVGETTKKAVKKVIP